jgi:ribose 5-phosphate isomerase B
MNTVSTIAFGADHAGFGLKDRLAAEAGGLGFGVLDVGANGPDSVDYPDYAQLVCRAVVAGKARFGILVCGTGIGMSIAANRFTGIRCALIHDTTGARLTRAHNNANIMALGARLIGEEVALDALRVFLATQYEGGRHERRLAKLNAVSGDTANLSI